VRAQGAHPLVLGERAGEGRSLGGHGDAHGATGRTARVELGRIRFGGLRSAGMDSRRYLHEPGTSQDSQDGPSGANLPSIAIALDDALGKVLKRLVEPTLTTGQKARATR
jgi:hypothetical protein